MKELLETYKRRLEIITKMIDELEFPDEANPTYIRYKTKEGCYRTMITELEREIKEI